MVESDCVDPNREASIRFEGVTVFRWSSALSARTVLLDRIDWKVNRGEHWVILGPNGAGKTTMLRLAGAMSQPSEGRVEVLGHRLGRVDIRLLRERIGFVDAGTSRALSGKRTALETVMTGAFSSIALQRQRLEPEHGQRARQLLAMLGTEALLERAFEDCSQGERQRILIARALMADPEMLLLDEPSVGLDLPSREELIEALGSLATDRPDVTTVSVTHHLEEIPPSCSHALLLRSGKVVARGPVEEVLGSDAISTCFGVPVEATRHRGRWLATVNRRR